MIVEVALSLPIEKTFHYAVPPALEGAVGVGIRVKIPFGPRVMTGFVVGIPAESSTQGLKSVIEIVDTAPVVTPDLLALARWMAGEYMCSVGEALSAVVPVAVRAPRRQRAPAAAPAPNLITPAAPPTLSPAQKNAVDQLASALAAGGGKTFVLNGVTASGKTEVYLAVMQSALAAGRQTVFLVPEIALTPQFIGLVQKRFPGQVGIWHSQLSEGEKYRTWDAARTGAVSMIVGARSAVFAPFHRPGLFIIDEEHESTYKQEQKPAYHTRDVAIERARLAGALVVLGSATPSLETYYAALSGRYGLLELPERIDNKPLPGVRVVDLNRLRQRSRVLSTEIIEAMTKTLARREQAIVFINRRGFAPGVMCHDCGQVWQCPHCSVSLVYHRATQDLRCHYCDHHQPWPGICPHCKSTNVAIFGVGTQKVEDELKRQFPQARVLRLDRDTTTKKGAYQQAYQDFKNEEVDILLGTQIVTKGFDFPRVTLVVVVDADTALYVPNFRAAERTFQLITQVAGRCGRSDLGGEVIIQSRHATHYALAAATRHDYKGFYNQELPFRREMHYPPFSRLASILVRGAQEKKVEDAARLLAEAVRIAIARDDIAVEILGPAPAAHYKLHNKFRWQIVLKGTGPAAARAAAVIKSLKLPSGIQAAIDIDPQDAL